MGEPIIDPHLGEADSGLRRALAYASFSHRFRALYGSVQTLPVLGEIARRVLARMLPHGRRVWVKVRAGLAQGLWLNVDPRYENAYAEGLYELTLQKVLAGSLSQGATFYDVGAHIGFFSLIAARLVGVSGRVFAFEADPENSRLIEQHASRSGFAQIRVLPVAVWSQSGTLHFQRALESSSRNTGSVLGAPSDQGLGEAIEVKAVTLDEFARNHGAPTLIKVDVEGGEGDVFRGADWLIANVKPVLICEVHNEDASSFIERYLVERRYSVGWLGPEPRFPRHLLAKAADPM